MISEDVLSTEYLGQDKPVNIIQPVVSVCVITYNHAAFIKECLDSILMQETDFPFEIIIGEDNSTDGTREICKEYAEKYPDKIRLFLRRPDQKIEVNGQKTFHFNFIEVLKAARGEYIALCEGDDYWTVNSKIQKQKSLLESDSLISAVSHSYLVSEKLQVILHGAISIDSMIYQLPTHTSTMMFRKIYIHDYLNNSSLLSVSFADYPISVLMALKGVVMALPDVMSNYRTYSGGVWTTLDSKESQFIKMNNRLTALKALGLDNHPATAKTTVNSMVRIFREENEFVKRITLLLKNKFLFKYLFFVDINMKKKFFKSFLVAK